MKIIKKLLKGSLIATGIGLAFSGGVFIGCKSLGDSIKRIYPEEARFMIKDTDIIRHSKDLTNRTRNDGDLIYQTLML